MTIPNLDLISGTAEEAAEETGIADLTQILTRTITEDGTAVEDGTMMTTAPGDLTQTRGDGATTTMASGAMGDLSQTKGAGATTTTTMVSGAIVGAAAGATMDKEEEARGGQTPTQEVSMAAEAMAEVRTVEAIMEEARIVEVTGLEVGLGSRLHPPRTRARMLASLWV